MTERVYLTKSRGGSGQWHWSRQWESGTRTACADLAVGEHRDPHTVPVLRRCRASGCRQRWDTWLAGGAA